MITICFTYFRSLALANLGAALHSLRLQDLGEVAKIIIVDNDTMDTPEEVKAVVGEWPVPVEVHSFKHGIPTRTHSWSTNTAVRMAPTEWVLFTRADYLLDPSLVQRFCQVRITRPSTWDGFVTSSGRHLHIDVGECEWRNWRINPSALQYAAGVDIDYTQIDSGVWMARRSAFDRVGGLDEKLTAWGHAQTHFQYKMWKSGVEFVKIPEVLFYHPLHSATRDLDLAHSQISARGVDLKQMWARYDGLQPYCFCNVCLRKRQHPLDGAAVVSTEKA